MLREFLVVIVISAANMNTKFKVVLPFVRVVQSHNDILHRSDIMDDMSVRTLSILSFLPLICLLSCSILCNCTKSGCSCWNYASEYLRFLLISVATASSSLLIIERFLTYSVFFLISVSSRLSFCKRANFSTFCA